MNRRTLFSMNAVLSITVSALLAGCAASPDASAPQIVPANEALPVMPADANASINNPRDLAAAEPDTAFVSAARDLGPAPGTPGSVNYQTLGQMLTQIDPKVQDRQTVYQLLVKFTSDDGLQWTTPFGVEISKGGDYIWICCILGPVTTQNPDLLKDLLSANSFLGDNFFAIGYDADKRLEIMHGFPNANITPDMLLANLNDLLSTVKKGEPLFKLVINPQ
jgi:hypothetical protein